MEPGEAEDHRAGGRRLRRKLCPRHRSKVKALGECGAEQVLRAGLCALDVGAAMPVGWAFAMIKDEKQIMVFGFQQIQSSFKKSGFGLQFSDCHPWPRQQEAARQRPTDIKVSKRIAQNYRIKRKKKQ